MIRHNIGHPSVYDEENINISKQIERPFLTVFLEIPSNELPSSESNFWSWSSNIPEAEMELFATSGLELFPVFFIVVLAVDLVGKSSSFSDENSESWWSKLQVNKFQKVTFVYHFNFYPKI